MSDDNEVFIIACSRGRRETTPKTPPLEERRRPGLSATLPYERRPDVCQSCGAGPDLFDGLIGFDVWEESDEWDQMQTPPVLVILCAKCSAKLINPHPRLYRQLDRLAPNLGAMPLCVDCKLREALSCRAPLAKQNGGPGMEVKWATQPTRYHVRGSGFAGYRWLFPGFPVSCAGKEPS